MRRSTSMLVLILLLLPLAVFALRFRGGDANQQRLESMLRAATPESLLHTYPKSFTYRITRNGSEFFEICLIEEVNQRYLPSGSPAAIFDSHGKLIDWTTDNGDDSTYMTKWYSGTKRTEIETSTLPK